MRNVDFLVYFLRRINILSNVNFIKYKKQGGFNKMKIIKDLRKLNSLAKRFNFKIDKEFKYLLSEDSLKLTRDLKKEGYLIRYISGCFYPFIFKEV